MFIDIHSEIRNFPNCRKLRTRSEMSQWDLLAEDNLSQYMLELPTFLVAAQEHARLLGHFVFQCSFKFTFCY